MLGASGGVGRAAIQLAHAMGARVLAGILRPERAASVRAAGADAVIDLSAADLRDSLRSQVYAATEGRGADIILDPLGGPIFEAGSRSAGLRLRAGIHIGPLQIEEGDVFDRTVNFAARVVGAIKGAEIWLSEQAKADIDVLGARRHEELRWQRHDSPTCLR